MNKQQAKQLKQQLRKNRVRAVVFGTPNRPRLAVFRSNSNISAQVIDDTTHKTIVGVSSANLKLTGKKVEQAMAVGKEIAAKAQAAGVKSVVYDRGGYKYHGRVKALAEAARENGLEF